MSAAQQQLPETPATTAPTTNSQALAPRTEIGVGQHGVILTSIEAMYRFANAVAKSGWAPKGMESPEAILVAIQYGQEVGLTPMASLQNIAVINGRPSMFGDVQLALVRASSKCRVYSEALTDDASHIAFIELQFAFQEADTKRIQELRKALALAGAAIKLDKDEQGFSCCTQRVDGELEFERYTIADAKRAGLWAKAGPWATAPKRMLKFRARTFLLRDNYGDILKGLASAEESLDIAMNAIEDRVNDSMTQPPVGRQSLRRNGNTNGHSPKDVTPPEPQRVEVVEDAKFVEPPESKAVEEGPAPIRAEDPDVIEDAGGEIAEPALIGKLRATQSRTNLALRTWQGFLLQTYGVKSADGLTTTQALTELQRLEALIPTKA